MDPLEAAQETLDAMLGYLGFVATVTVDPESHSLHVVSRDSHLLIGERGERLEEITHLVNRLLLDRIPGAPRVQVDIDGYLASRDERMLEEAEEIAARVAATGRPMKLVPMNSYQRRLIHTHFKDHPTVRTWSPEDHARLKRISIAPRNGS
ncbi:MAG TPA: R3H domain-containing nucleic acid-binding protein [Bacteroidia bacterium]|nr:R3H domain-containing nucleic acid-binding protein [Bacteroidia bacterium]